MYIYIFLFYWKNSGFPLQWPFHNRISICFLPQTNPHVEGLSLRQFREFQNALGFEHDLRELRLGFATAKFSHSKCMVKLLMEEILHHLGCIKPWKYWDKPFINWCRISSINRINGFIHHGVLWLRETLWLQMRNCWFERMISPNCQMNHTCNIQTKKALAHEWNYQIQFSTLHVFPFNLLFIGMNCIHWIYRSTTSPNFTPKRCWLRLSGMYRTQFPKTY